MSLPLVLLVLGMHRSGTSATARALNCVGADVPSVLLEANEFNEQGYWEPKALVELNDELLAACDSRWDDWRAFDWDRLSPYQNRLFADRAREQLRGFLAGRERLVLKDPRICRLLPFWRPVLLDLDVRVKLVLVFRHPDEVARSLAHRDGMSRSEAHLLWLRHNLDAERDSRGLVRAVVDFSAMVKSPTDMLCRMAEVLSEDWIERSARRLGETALGIDAKLKHFANAEGGESRDTVAEAMPERVRVCLHRLADDPVDPVAYRRLDAFSARFKKASGLFDEALYDSRKRTEQLSIDLAQRDSQLAVRAQEVGEFERQLAVRSREIGELQEQLAVRTRKLGELEQQLVARTREVGELDRQVAVCTREAGELERQLAGCTRKSSELERQLAERTPEIGELHRQLADRALQIGELNHQLRTQAAEAHQVEESGAFFKGKVAGLEARVHRLADVAGVATESLQEARRDLVRQVKLSEKLAARVRSLEGSTSWRVTAPIRAMVELARRRRSEGERQDWNVDLAVGVKSLKRLAVEPASDLEVEGPVSDRAQQPKLPDRYVEYGPFAEASETVLVVTHEASRTGAPILALNLCKHLATRYNVVAVTIGGGPLVAELAASCCGVLGPVVPGPSEELLRGGLEKVKRERDPSFAIVNSIESRAVLEMLFELRIPSIALVHEFASYTRPIDGIRTALLWSTMVVYSADVVKRSTLDYCPDARLERIRVLPQGRPEVPAMKQPNPEAMERVRRTVRGPDPHREDPPAVILGAGFVHIRKGVDLFLQVAAVCRRIAGGKRLRFVWIGGGYDPIWDSSYSVYLHDQIERAGLEESVQVLREISEFNEVYRYVDAFLLSSRLDPLPNVAIEAVFQDVPVVCFEGTTGIAEYLHEAGVGDRCVAPFFDVETAARLLLDLISDQGLREGVCAAARAFAAERFDMHRYVETLVGFGSNAGEAMACEREDADTILGGGGVRIDFFLRPSNKASTDVAACERFVRTWRTGIDLRKPIPGFHPGIFSERYGRHKPTRDAFAEYLSAGRPAGPWSCDVITPASSIRKGLAAPRIALHIHVFYVDLLGQILSALGGSQTRPDLLVSVTEQAAEAVADELTAAGWQPRAIKVAPNRGRDIGPLLLDFADILQNEYEVFGHLHTKKSADVADPAMGQRWFSFLLGNLLGGNDAMMDRIVSALVRDCSLGLVFPDDPHVVGWGANHKFAVDLAARMGISEPPDGAFNFPVGTMFWAKTAALAPLLDLGLSWEDLPDEPLPYDGSLLHAVERMIPFVCSSQGYRFEVTNVPGVTR